jgi:hypothetical protein
VATAIKPRPPTNYDKFWIQKYRKLQIVGNRIKQGVRRSRKRKLRGRVGKNGRKEEENDEELGTFQKGSSTERRRVWKSNFPIEPVCITIIRI